MEDKEKKTFVFFFEPIPRMVHLEVGTTGDQKKIDSGQMCESLC